MRVRRLAEDDWRQLQGIRLRSLTEDHPVLGSVEREQGFRESHWRMRIRGSAWFVATHRRRTVGIASVIAEPGTPVDERHVVGLWVAPEARGTTAWAALLDAAAADRVVPRRRRRARGRAARRRVRADRHPNARAAGQVAHGGALGAGARGGGRRLSGTGRPAAVPRAF